MASPGDTDQGDFSGIDFLQFLAVADGNQPVAGAVKDIGVAIHMADPFIGAQLVAEHIFDGQKRQETFHCPGKIIVRCIQDQVAGLVVRSDLGGKAAAQAPAIDQDMVFGVLGFEGIIHKLHVVEHVLFPPFSGAFSKAAVIHQDHIITVTGKVQRIAGPAFDAAGVSMEIKDQALGVVPEKMQAIDPYPRGNIEKQFPERAVIFEFKILLKLFGLEYEFVLQQIGQQGEQGNGKDNIEKCLAQGDISPKLMEKVLEGSGNAEFGFPAIQASLQVDQVAKAKFGFQPLDGDLAADAHFAIEYDGDSAGYFRLVIKNFGQGSSDPADIEMGALPVFPYIDQLVRPARSHEFLKRFRGDLLHGCKLCRLGRH
jgi:hypothetical protein